MKRDILLAEFVGTFALTFIGVGSIAANSITNGALGVTGIALAHGLTIAVMASAFGVISGGHFNPAVSIGAMAAKKLNAQETLGYVVSQLLGAILAAICIKYCIAPDVLAKVGMGTPSLGQGVSVGQGFVMEVILTFFLVTVIFGTAIDKRAPKCGGLFIGLTVTLDILCGGPFTGAAMNPARYMGPALFGGGLSQAWLYWIAPTVGGVVAALFYKEVFIKE